MNKQSIYTFRGSNQDISKSKHSVEYYFKGQHIKLLATDSQTTGNITNEKGNAKVLTIPTVKVYTSISEIQYGDKKLNFSSDSEIPSQIGTVTSKSQIIIGHAPTRDGMILFTTDDKGVDCIWKLGEVLSGEYSLELLYLRNLNFKSAHPIQAIFNYENENIQKVYWVDSINQVRNINTTYNSIEGNAPLIDLKSSNLNFVGEVSLSQPIASDTKGGGKHTAGMIQYAYNLYNLNGSQTTISPLSEMISLDNDVQGGGLVNDIVNSTPTVTIKDIDTSYSHIRVYAIKYTSYNEIPSVSLIEEREISGTNTITIYDDGGIISTLSLSEFIFLGSDPSIPSHIETKDSNLFLFNVKTKDFLIPEELDTRAYSFPLNSTTTYVIDKVTGFAGNRAKGPELLVTNTFSVPPRDGSINASYDDHRYQYNSSILGGEGKYLKYQLLQNPNVDPLDNRFFKDREMYRIGIKFYNRLGQDSLPKWIADFKAPAGNLDGTYNTLSVTLKPEFYTWLNTYAFSNPDDKPVGFKIIRVDRQLKDKTIICQGGLNAMMSNSTTIMGKNGDFLNSAVKPVYEAGNKIPSLQRAYDDSVKIMTRMEDGRKLNPFYKSNNNAGNEVIKSTFSKDWRGSTYQYNKIFQMFSPDVTFNNVSLSGSLKLRIIGAYRSDYNAFWGAEVNTTTLKHKVEGKVLNGIHPSAPNIQKIDEIGGVGALMDLGIFGPASKTNDAMDFLQFYRSYLGAFDKSNRSVFNIYGSPEITERGQSKTFYNGDANFDYYNTLEPMITDQREESNAITSVNSWGAKCVTMVEGSESASYNKEHRRTLEKIFRESGLSYGNSIMMGELIIPEDQIYKGNIYGGNSYEDKKRNSYIDIGEYKELTNNDTIEINSPGDTYVQTFRFLKMSKTDTEVYDHQSMQITEIVQFKVETEVDLKNRKDISITNWDSRFQPKDDEYHEYNRVYSQQPNLLKSTDVGADFKRISNFDTRIQASKAKVPNESIDSWTDLLPNEVMDLDGKFGPINGVASFNDNIFTFQDNAIASISINPRVQVQASDGIGLELGTGNILYDYNYITTKSGSINKWSILGTKKGVYYYDALNKGFSRVPDAAGKFLSDLKGYHSYFNNNHNYNDIKIDNPILKKGVSIGYDNYNDDVYLTLHQGDKTFTLCYNEEIEEFVDNKLYHPSHYMYKGEKFLLSDPSNDKLYEHYAGEYNKFFEKYEPSYIILQLNPESNYTTVFNNIKYNSELYLNDIDQPDKTLTHIQCYSEYQDSGLVPLVVGRDKNLRRKFREWKANIPRMGRSRMRNPWVYLKLQLSNEDNYKLVLHDIILDYTV